MLIAVLRPLPTHASMHAPRSRSLHPMSSLRSTIASCRALRTATHPSREQPTTPFLDLRAHDTPTPSMPRPLARDQEPPSRARSEIARSTYSANIHMAPP